MAVHHIAAFFFQDISPARDDYVEDWRTMRQQLICAMYASFPDALFRDVVGYTNTHARSAQWPFPASDELSADRKAILLQAVQDDPRSAPVAQQRHPSLFL